MGMDVDHEAEVGGKVPADFAPRSTGIVGATVVTMGLIALPQLPVSEYPDVVPPTVQVRAMYPGANPKVIAETVATPLEEAINGVENMMYMKSVASSDGVLTLTVTFNSEVDADEATVRVQNRVSQALARLPEDVRRQGVTTQKQSPVFLMVVHLTSKDGKYDSLYLRNYMRLHVKDSLARIPGVGDAQAFGGGDYAMRAWIDPDKVAARLLTTRGKPGRPWPSVGGKYVPPKNGLSCGVRKTLIGQPPEPVMACTAAMYTSSRSGRSSRSTLIDTKCSFMSAAISAFSKLSRSITWHQWQAA